MSPSEPLLVNVAYPDIEKLVDVSRVPAVDPRIEMTVTSYVENMELRTAKRLGPDAPGLAEMAPPLDDDYRDALARAEVMFCLDAPLHLPDAGTQPAVDPGGRLRCGAVRGESARRR